MTSSLQVASTGIKNVKRGCVDVMLEGQAGIDVYSLSRQGYMWQPTVGDVKARSRHDGHSGPATTLDSGVPGSVTPYTPTPNSLCYAAYHATHTVPMEA